MECSGEAYFGKFTLGSGMTTSSAAEMAFEKAMKSAKDRGDTCLSIEHLLIKLLSEESALVLLESSNVDLIALRSSLVAQIDETIPKSALPQEPQAEPQLRQVPQRAVMKMMATNNKSIEGADYLIAVHAQDD